MEKTKVGAIAVFVIGLLGIILSASWDWILRNSLCEFLKYQESAFSTFRNIAGSECCMGNYQIAGIAGGVIVAVVGAVLLVYKPKPKEEKEEEKKEEKLKEKKEKK